ncbi:MAG: flagellar biosynthetic protein FliR [Candidatus Zixiibacteriota bacterium]
MFEFVQFGAAQIETFLLVLMRASGIFIIAPVFGNRSIPALAKVGVLLALAIVMAPTLSTSAVTPTESVWQLAGLAAKEILVGVIIGLVFQLIFIGAKTAGSMVGYQIGFALVSMPDVEEGGQITILGRFWYVVALLIFLSIDGHHLVLSAFADSYEVMPPGVVAMVSSVGELIIKYTAYVFIIALKMAAPVMITLFLTDVALGTIAKTMPTMNVFFVGFPVKIGVGLLVIALSLPVFSYVLQRGMGYLDGELRLALAAMGRV